MTRRCCLAWAGSAACFGTLGQIGLPLIGLLGLCLMTAAAVAGDIATVVRR